MICRMKPFAYFEEILWVLLIIVTLNGDKEIWGSKEIEGHRVK